MYTRLMDEGHEVRVNVEDPASTDIMLGLVPRGEGLEADLAWKCADGLVVFETTASGAKQDALRRVGHRVVGGSEIGDRLELDRAFGQDALRRAGLRIAPVQEVRGWDAAITFVRHHPGRYVLKFSGTGFSSTRTYVGVLPDGRDLVAALHTQKRQWSEPVEPTMILMQHLEGVEVGVGGYFNGTRFLRPLNLDWEHKRFFPGDLGELTGEMGTVVTYRDAEPLFKATLERMTPLLREAGHRGYVNLNLIVNEDGVFPLEFTSRFGYPGFAILGALQTDSWATLLSRMADGDDDPFTTMDGYAVGIVVTVPPYPYSYGYERLSKGSPICFDALSPEDEAGLYYGEVRKEEDELVTAGQVGYVLVSTGTGSDVPEAKERALALAKKVVVPKARYRIDIGDRLVREDRARLRRLGWMT
jgi:phosphoribosylamine--glycine ligase